MTIDNVFYLAKYSYKISQRFRLGRQSGDLSRKIGSALNQVQLTSLVIFINYALGGTINVGRSQASQAIILPALLHVCNNFQRNTTIMLSYLITCLNKRVCTKIIVIMWMAFQQKSVSDKDIRRRFCNSTARSV